MERHISNLSLSLLEYPNVVSLDLYLPTNVTSETRIVMNADDKNVLIAGRDLSDSVMTTRRTYKYLF